MIKIFAIERLLLDSNSPRYWYKNKEFGKIVSAFGSVKNYENMPKKWSDFNLLKENVFSDCLKKYVEKEFYKNKQNCMQHLHICKYHFKVMQGCVYVSLRAFICCA